ncbi:MAG: hypothetical protein ACOC5T_02365 [Elusimicrobiota bacterium]
MADTSGQAKIRGLDIDKVVKGFADESFIFKNLIRQATTSAREIRWYQRTAGILEGTSPADIDNVDFGAQPFSLEQSWTRNTSYVKKYFVESPTISEEDIQDADIDVLAGNLRDLTRAVAYQVDQRIWNVITENQTADKINTVSSTSPWDGSGQNPIDDIMNAKEKIRNNGYDPDMATLLLSPKDERSLMDWIISEKGANIPSYSNKKVESGAVNSILGLNVRVSTNVTDDYAAVMVGERAATWKQFTPLKSMKIEDPGVGTKIRVLERGECLLTDPKAVTLITDTQE